MESSRDHIIYDGKITPSDELVIPAVSRGLMYGDGVFETFLTYSGQTFFLEQHLQRLKSGLNFLGIPIPSGLSDLKRLIFELLQKKDLLKNNTIVRLQVWREGKRGYLPGNNAKPHFSITASRCADSFKNPVLATVGTKRIPSAALPADYKFSNGINYILAAKEASRKGADDALMLTIDEKISETTIGNIFWCKGDKTFTPSKKCDLIPGITRKVIIYLIEDQCKLQEGEFKQDSILTADAVFMTNSVREILPVSAIDNHSFDSQNETVNKLQENFFKFRDKHLKPLR